MSHFTITNTVFKDKAALIDALVATGFPRRKINREMIEVHEVPQPLYGYEGDARPERAHLIIRRKHISSSSNDIGFIERPDGSYRAIISEFDEGSKGLDAKWMGRVAQSYATVKATKALQKRGMKVTTKKEGNNIRIVGVG